MTSILQAARRAATESLHLDLSANWRTDTARFGHALRRLWLFRDNQPAALNLEQASGAYYFLLYKSLSVTNISVHEVSALLRLHAFTVGDSIASAPIQFYTGVDYSTFAAGAWESYAYSFQRKKYANKQDAEKAVHVLVAGFVKAYEEILRTTIVVDFYYTSFLVAIPPSLSINLASVVAESGYIHSGGPVLYARNIEKANHSDLESRIASFLGAEEKRKIFVVPYAEEFFSPYDGDSPVSVRNGLDNVKFKIRKHFVEGLPLYQYLTTLPERFEGQLYVPKGLKNFQEERLATIEDGADEAICCTTDCTLWFVVDSNFEVSATTGWATSGVEGYLFVYAQYLLNENPFILFKERKPAWYAPITLPHSLSLAAVNVLRNSRRVRRADGSPVILDPFSGTGTSLIDYGLRDGEATLIGLDRTRIAHQTVKDNLEFFAMYPDEIQRLRAVVDAIGDALSKEKVGRTLLSIAEIAADRETILGSQDDELGGDHKTIYENACALLLSELARKAEVEGLVKQIEHALIHGFSDDFLDWLSSKKFSDLNCRLILFVMWRACVTGIFSIRSEGDAELVFQNELASFSKELREFERIVRAPTTAAIGGGHESCQGTYSASARVTREAVRSMSDRCHIGDCETLIQVGDLPSLGSGLHLFHVADSIATLRNFRGQIDVIITDPPYGFNSEEGGEESLSQLYAELATNLVSALVPGGEMILVLPEYARNGRQIPFFETKDAMVRQVLAAARKQDRMCIKSAESFPITRSVFCEFPARWTSASVLERRIVRFIIQ